MNQFDAQLIIEGRLRHIVYHNEESLYTVARLTLSPGDNTVVIVGRMAGVSPGERLRVHGNWETHPRFGQQFKIKSCEVTLPASVDGIREYLQSGVIKGIGPGVAGRLVHAFGADTLKVIEKEPDRLLEIYGIGKKTASAITDAWKEHHALRGLMAFLQKAGVSASFCADVFKAYGKESLDIITDDPYRLAYDLPKIGFHIAEAVGKMQGIETNDPKRVRACIIHALERLSDEGHVFAYEEKLYELCLSMFQIDPEIAQNEMENLAASRLTCIDEPENDSYEKPVYLERLYQAETGIAEKLGAMMSIPFEHEEIDPEVISERVHQKTSIFLSDEQIRIMNDILSYQVAIITGGPGTGKTTLIRSVNALFESLGKRVLLAAPTGRAARRLSEVTRREAKTIHRLLEYNFIDNSFRKNRDIPLDAEAVIIDEASMVDVVLMYHLLMAIPATTVLILVGDVFQLPSVGPGNVLSDLIESSRIPVLYLKEIFRQAQESDIIVNAHRVLNGEIPELLPLEIDRDDADFFFVEENYPERAAQTIVNLCGYEIPKRFNLDPIHEIQALTPMHKGAVGTIRLNQLLQEALNPARQKLKVPGGVFKLGDKVMHLINDYKKEVFNGDIGIIREIDKKKGMLQVNYYGRTVSYELSETASLSPAYATTIHKSQGSEYPCVIVSMMMQHYVLLQRNLLYTAMTRGKQLVVIVGMKKAVAIALKNDKPGKRLTKLSERMRA